MRELSSAYPVVARCTMGFYVPAGNVADVSVLAGKSQVKLAVVPCKLVQSTPSKETLMSVNAAVPVFVRAIV